MLADDAKAVARAFAAGADPNYVSGERAAAAWAVERGKLPIVEAFIAAGLDVSLSVDEGWSLLMLAATEKVARALLAAGADVNHQSPGSAHEKSDTVLTLAAKIHPAEVVAALLEHGADPNRARADGCTPLIEAGARLDVVELLLQAGAVDVAGYRGQSALDIAIECRNDRLVALLKQSAGRS
ncbi:MAG: ankyrin repeat domain-containing protein [Myxococcales bacterium]|nr:ankyrin repeat domain-containing protein [Myxococcales bacterium]